MHALHTPKQKQSTRTWFLQDCTTQARACLHAGCTFSASIHHETLSYLSIAHEAPHQNPQTAKDDHYSQVSGATLLHLARKRQRLKSSAFINDASERHTNNYQELDAIELNDEIAHNQTYAYTNKDSNTVTRNVLLQIHIQICDLCNEHDCNDCMSTLRENCNKLEEFLNGFLIISTIRKVLQREMEESISLLGLEQFISGSFTGLEYARYQRNAKNVFQNQVRECKYDNMIASIVNGMSFTHPLEAETGFNVYIAVEHELKFSEDPFWFWETMQTNVVFSIVGCLELFSSKSHAALCTVPPQFFSLLVTSLNSKNATDTQWSLTEELQ